MRIRSLGVMAALLAFWAALVAASLASSLDVVESQARAIALERARMLFTVIETTRLWNARHGGVYVPVDDRTAPNPWLEDSDRDVSIDGRAFTKVNPAYMTRQVADMVRERRGVWFHLTSLKPIRPGNGPDEWEAGALKRFEAGERELMELSEADGAPAFRYMAALTVEKPCLACHRKQGYELGQIRGGLSVTMPAEPLLAELGPQRRQIVVIHLFGFLLLSGASMLFAVRLRRSWRALAEAKAEQSRVIAEQTGELRTANNELARSNAELENFAYVASHDLQEPLRMMGSYAQLVERRYGGALDGDGREFLGYISEGAGRMKAMIDDLLAYSRVDRGVPERDEVDMELVVDAALANLAAALTESQAVIVRPSPLPMVQGELGLLVRLLQNLIGNAVKYRRPGAVPHVTVSAEADGSGWRFSVADDGIGIPEDARERVFMIFQRLHGREAYAGTGIGLAICRKIVERHGGRIWVDEAPGGGSVFRFTLPGS
ncbi:MAG: sensor histidine kinase [Actinomycetota bacterium]